MLSKYDFLIRISVDEELCDDQIDFIESEYKTRLAPSLPYFEERLASNVVYLGPHTDPKDYFFVVFKVVVNDLVFFEERCVMACGINQDTKDVMKEYMESRFDYGIKSNRLYGIEFVNGTTIEVENIDAISKEKFDSYSSVLPVIGAA